jgi:hypothetical protein
MFSRWQALPAEIAHRGYALGFTNALLVAAAIGGFSAVLVAVLMRPQIAKTSTRAEMLTPSPGVNISE